MLKDFDLLGKRVRDRITGFEGICASIGYDLYGCIQVVVSPPMKDPGKLEDGRWFDSKRMEVLDDKPVMEVPNFEVSVDKQLKIPGGVTKTIPRGI